MEEMKKERLWNRNYIKVMTANFALFFAFYLLTPLLPLYLSEAFGAQKDTIGLVLSGYTVAALLMRPFSGFLVDSFPRKRVLMLCMAVYFAFFASYLVAGTLLMFTLIRTLHGAPYGAVTVANSTVAIDVLPASRRNEGIGYYGLSNNVSMALAPTVGLLLYRWSGSFELLFWIAFAVAGVGLAVDATVSLPQRELKRNQQRLSLDRFFLTRGWLLAVNIVFFGFCFGVLSNYLAIYSHQALGITSGTGTYFMLLAVGLFVSRLQGAKMLGQGRLTHNAAEGVVISLTGYGLFALIALLPSGSLWALCCYYVSAALIGLGNGHMYPAFLNMFIAVARHDERGTANSSILTAWDVGMGAGVLLGGVAAEHLGYGAAFLLVWLANAIGVALFFAKTRQFFQRRKRADSLAC